MLDVRVSASPTRMDAVGRFSATADTATSEGCSGWLEELELLELLEELELLVELELPEELELLGASELLEELELLGSSELLELLEELLEPLGSALLPPLALPEIEPFTLLM
jgi:hypothetical protein